VSGPQAWAEDVTLAGRVRWEQPLTSTPLTDVVLEPVMASDVAVFAYAGGIYGVRASDGRRLWKEAVAPGIQGIWAQPSTVTVVTGAGSQTELFSFDITSGRKRWMAPLPNSQAAPPQLAGGGLAALAPDGALEDVATDTGRVRWINPAATAGYPGPAVMGSLVFGGAAGRVSAYSIATGTRVWSASGMPSSPTLQAIGGLILVTAVLNGPRTPTGIIALSASTGRVLWRLDPGVLVDVQSAGPAGLEMDSDQPARLYLVNAASGQVKWHAATPVETGSTPLITASDMVYVRNSPTTTTAQLVARRTRDGAVLWKSRPFAGQVSPVTPLGKGLAAVSIWGQAGYLRAFSITTGKIAWQVRLPAAAAAPPAAPLVTADGMLVQAIKQPTPPCPVPSPSSP